MNILRSKKFKLLKGDCFKLMDILIKQGIKFDAIITDPPFGSTACSWDNVLDFSEMWKRLQQLKKDKSTPVILFGTEPFSSNLRLSNIYEYKYDLIWVKEKLTNPFLVKKQFGRVHENISVFYKKQCTYNPMMSKRDNVTNPKPMKGDLNVDETNVISGVYKHSLDYNPELVYPTSILKFNRDGKKGSKALHPTQKPLALMEYLIKTFSNEDDLILDFTMGSGTTGVAALKLNRRFVGIEQNVKYFKIAKNRINKKLNDE